MVSVHRSKAVLFASALALVANAQPQADRGQGQALILKADSLFRAGSHGAALEALETIHPSDTLYEGGLFARIFVLRNDSDATAALALCREGVRLGAQRADEFRQEIPGLLIALERYDEAVRAADSAIAELPGNFRVRWQKARALKKRGNVNEALRVAMDNAKRFPYHPDAHSMLADMAWSEGHVAEAALAMAMGQIVGAGYSTAEPMLVAYDGWLGQSPAGKSAGLDFSIAGDDLEEIDQLLQSQVAMSGKYKVKPDLEYPTCRQSHLLFNAIAERPEGTGGFYERFYGPLIRALVKEERFEGFVYHCLAASTNEKVHAIAEKNRSKITAFTAWVAATIERLYIEFPDDEGMPALVHFYFDNKNLHNRGKLDRTANLAVGEWTTFTPFGRVEVSGAFDAKGERDGRWISYGPTGLVQSVTPYVGGKAEGLFLKYHENGNIADSIPLRDGKWHGAVKNYYRSGGLRSVKEATDGVLNGPVKEYFPTGAVEWEYAHVQDAIEGPVTQYHPDGSVREKGQFSKGTPTGLMRDHHPNGNVELEQQFTLGKSEGPYKRWHADGTLAEEGTRKAGALTGERHLFDAWGQLYRVERYDEEGRLHGTYEEYADDGKLVLTMEMNKDLLMRYVYQDREGRPLADEKRAKGRFQWKGYGPDGSLSAEGVYQDDGTKEGVWKYYHTDGTLRSEEEFRKGARTGTLRVYDKSGRLERTVADYTRNGITYTATTDLYPDGSVQAEGQARDGKMEGVFRRYYPDGTLRRVEYYVENEAQGWQEVYDPGGKLEYAERMDAGALAERVSCDEEGRVYERITVPAGLFEMVTHYPTGEVYGRIGLLNGHFHGRSTWYYPDGTVATEGSYVNGERHGTWTGRYPDGGRSWETAYEHGKATGTSRQWSREGVLTDETPYVNGARHGASLEFHDNGKASFVREYQHGELHGTVTTYSHDGTPQMKRFYHKGRLWGYGSITAQGGVKDTVRIAPGRADIRTSFANGKPSRSLHYRNEEIDGEFTEYHPNGQVMESSTFEVGEQVGLSTEYFANGQVMSKVPFKNGLMHGRREVYWEDGKPRETANYVFGVMHGERVVHDRTGKRKATYHMRNDDILRIGP